MAKQVITKIMDDLTGEEADESVSFALDGNLYEIDLTSPNASELRTFLERYIEAGTRMGRVGSGAQTRPYSRSSNSAASAASYSNRAENQAIREWANSNNYELADRGRIPQHIVDAYHARSRSAAAALDEEVEKAAKKAAPAKKAAGRKPAAAQFASA